MQAESWPTTIFQANTAEWSKKSKPRLRQMGFYKRRLNCAFIELLGSTPRERLCVSSIYLGTL